MSTISSCTPNIHDFAIRDSDNSLGFSSNSPDNKNFLKKIVPAVKKIGNVAGKVATITGKVATIAAVL